MTTTAHALPVASVVGGVAASLLAWVSTDPLTGLAVATGALFFAWLAAMFAAQYLPMQEHHGWHLSGHNHR